MGPIKIVEVLSFSSEDPKHPADNLLKADSYEKWKCIAGSPEKQVYVILKLESLTRINSIDIGNESSAFVEVLVGREGVDYKVLLPASSFMSPLEARNNTQTNRVRLFPVDKLTKAIAEEKWDRVKIICTQPFNKSLQYGLSFIKLHSIEKVEAANQSRHSIGAFTLNDPNSDDDSIKVGTFFKNIKPDVAKRDALGNNNEKDGQNSKIQMPHTEESTPNAPNVGFYQPKKIEKFAKRPLEETVALSSDIRTGYEAKKHKKQQIYETKVIKAEKDSTKDKHREIKPQAVKVNESEVKRKHRPFCQLLDDVVFVLSGYENPLRSELRDKMTELGARYKSDWNKTCTHLLCAFKNTPKYRAIKGKGIIVSEKWTEDCYKSKKRFSSTRYLLEKGKNPIAEEEEIWADEIMPKIDVKPIKKTEADQIPENPREGDISDYEAETEDEDTDDEIRRVMANQKEPKNSYTSSTLDQLKEESVYDDDTDIDEDCEIQDTSRLELPALSDYFSNKIFFLYGSLNENKTKLIKRYIIAFNGKIEDYMTKEVNYVITEDPWDENFEQALCDNPNLQFVRPQWIWRCSEKQKFVPPQPYVVVPKEIE